MANVDLATKWLELVEKDQVAVSTTIKVRDKDDKEQKVGVRYGVRVHPNSSPPEQVSYMEFVQGTDEISSQHPTIATINTTLVQAAAANADAPESVQFRFHGNYVAQLQLVRTLRPPPSPGFGTSLDTKSSSTPPEYNSETDSFVTGPLRLQMRPLIAKLNLSSLTTPWDIFHNVSPADVRGHFLLIPTLDDPDKNWREQALRASDCSDLVYLTASVEPVGSLFVCFNSVGAGASQNHIHCHLWPSPPIPLLEQRLPTTHNDHDESTTGNSHDHDHCHEHTHSHNEDTEIRGWNCYPVSLVQSIYDFTDITNDDGETLVEVSYLDYPCFCIQLSSVSHTKQDNQQSLSVLGKAIWEVSSCIGDAPHNVCLVNRPAADNAGLNDVDVYMFIRSRERSPTVVPESKLGASEMMGVFHCQSRQQLEELTQGGYDESPMEQALQEVSHDQTDGLWDTIKAKLSSMEC